MLHRTYGSMPSYKEFKKLYIIQFGSEYHTYEVRNCHLVGDNSYTCKELDEECVECTKVGDIGEEKGFCDWVSCVLSTLGIVWV